MTPKKRGKGQSGGSSKKSAKKSATGPKLVPQPNGRGALLSGGQPGNKGGTGRPPNEIRAMLRETVGGHGSVVDDIASGKPIQRIEVPLLSLLPHASCPKCGDRLVSELSAGDQILITIEGKVSASPRDRIAALEYAARYGLGALKDISVDSVRERMQRTLDILQARTTPEQYVEIVRELQPVWE